MTTFQMSFTIQAQELKEENFALRKTYGEKYTVRRELLFRTHGIRLEEKTIYVGKKWVDITLAHWEI